MKRKLALSLMMFLLPLAMRAQVAGIFSNVNNVVYSSPAYASLNAAVAACPLGGGCTVIINAPASLSANLTVPATVTLQFAQPGTLTTTGFTLTVNGPIVAGPYRIFAGSGTVTFGAPVTQPSVEWFGAVGDWNGSTGTDNTAPIQACLNAVANGQCGLLAKAYETTAPLIITRSAVGITGVAMGLPNSALYPTPSASEIIITSATADILDVSGASTSSNITYNKLTNFTLARSVAPGTNAAGLRLSFSYGAMIDGVTSQDSTAGFLFHGVGSQGTGYITNSAATWGYNGFAETSGSLAGFEIDSSSGVASPSLRIRNSFAVANTTLSGATTIGLESNGSALNDLMVDHFETATVNFGVFLQAATTSVPSTDIHILNSINDGCITTCIFIQNIGGSVEVSGGWNFRQSSTLPVIDIRTSSHVDITNLQIFYPTGTGVGLSANVVGGLRVSHNDFMVGGGSALFLTSVSASTFTSNIMNGITATSIVNVVNSSGDVIADNTINGTATNGIALDATSTSIAGLDTNQIGDPALGTITNLLTDNGSTPSSHTLSATLTGGCATGSTSFSTCTNTLTWTSGGFTQVPSYVTCQGINPSDPRAYWQVTTVTPTTITVQTVTGGGASVSFGSLSCIGRS